MRGARREGGHGGELRRGRKRRGKRGEDRRARGGRVSELGFCFNKVFYLWADGLL